MLSLIESKTSNWFILSDCCVCLFVVCSLLMLDYSKLNSTYNFFSLVRLPKIPAGKRRTLLSEKSLKTRFTIKDTVEPLLTNNFGKRTPPVGGHLP